MTDPNAEAIRAAFDAAAFDERTPDEAGFAGRFETEFKPLLKEGVEFNLNVRAARLRRRRMGKIIAAAVAVFLIPTIVLLNASISKQAWELTFYGVVIAGPMIYGWAFQKRPSEEDPNQTKIVKAVLEAFGCRLARWSPLSESAIGTSPVRPRWSSMSVLVEHIVGNFDGRMPFIALRVRTTIKQGKSTSETFRGWYLRVDLPFSFSGTTAIREFLTPSYRYGDGVDVRTMSEVSLEDPEFARRYFVSASDQVEARMILTPDVMEHLKKEADRFAPEGKGWNPSGNLMLGFSGRYAHVWMPSRASALSDWQPLDPGRLIQDIHEAFDELSAMRGFLRDIDVIAESEGFRAQAARNARPVSPT